MPKVSIKLYSIVCHKKAGPLDTFLNKLCSSQGKIPYIISRCNFKNEIYEDTVQCDKRLKHERPYIQDQLNLYEAKCNSVRYLNFFSATLRSIFRDRALILKWPFF